jgi:serine/threonine protein kinase
MTKEGIAKITDFGLASARNAGRIEFRKIDESTSNLVSVHGMTEAYCSPEQASWQKLSHKTDIWSWGLSVLEMFTGSVTWKNGSIAGYILEDYLKKGPSAPYPKMPDSLVEVLHKCFIENPEERWNTLDEAVEYLKKIYKQETGKPYFREKPKSVSKIRGNEIHDRSTLGGVSWDDPVKWLNRAFQASNMDIAEMDNMIPERKGSRKAQALVDLEMYEQTESIYTR